MTRQKHHMKKMTHSLPNRVDQLYLQPSTCKYHHPSHTTRANKTCQIHAKRHRLITTISFEPVRKKFNGKERYVGVIHSLQVDAFLVIFEVGY